MTRLGLIGRCFAAQLVMARPDMAVVVHGLIPTSRFLTDPQMLYFGLGVLGATVMAHNLFLHSFVLQTRRGRLDPAEAGSHPLRRHRRQPCAVLRASPQCAILVLAAAVFHARD